MLWRKVRQGLSAGRVQSVATRLVVERERERMAFRRRVATGTSSPMFAPEGDRELELHRAAGRRRRAAGSRPVATSPTRPSSSAPTSCTSTRRSAEAIASGIDARRVRRALGPGEALHPPAGRAVHHLDAAAGGQPQAALLQQARDERRPSGCTRTATSPTCAPTPRRCREAALSAARSQARELYGDDYVPQAPRALRAQGQERPGGPRGDPPGRRPLPHAGPGRRGAARRGVRALRADLEAHRRLADGRRRGLDRHRPARRDAGRRPRRRAVRLGHRHHVPRFPRGVRRGS